MLRRLFAIACVLGPLWADTALAEETTVLADDEVWTDAYDNYFQKYSKRYFGPHFDWKWFKAQAIAESRLNPKARSGVGAVGLMQLMPPTFDEIKQENPHFANIEEPRWNIAAGIYYDRMLFRKIDLPSEQERLLLAFASYNAGYSRILRAMRASSNEAKTWEEIKQYAPPETRFYVKKIRKLMDMQPRINRIGEKGIAQLLADEDA